MTRQLVPLREVPKHRPWTSERYLRRLVQGRRIAFHKIGARIYLDLADVDAHAEAGRVEPPKSARLRAVRGGQ